MSGKLDFLRLYNTKEAYLIQRGDASDDSSCLVVLRSEQRMYPMSVRDGRSMLGLTAVSLSEAIQAVLGRLEIEGESYLFVVSDASHAATLTSYDQKEYPVMRVDRVRALPLSTAAAAAVGGGQQQPNRGLGNAGKNALNKLKSGKQALLKFVNDKMINPTPSMLEEILRLLNPTPTTSDFYYCKDRDITHSTQRHFEQREKGEPDERFFWNRHMLDDLYREDVNEEMAKPWRLPITQGFASSSELRFDGEEEEEGGEGEGKSVEGRAVLRVTLLSRRGVKRAGARYLRRGIDDDANVANFVETELLLNNDGHHVSFVQVRGSIPFFWTQEGMRYRPPLAITKTLDESAPFFVRHLERLREDYRLKETRPCGRVEGEKEMRKDEDVEREKEKNEKDSGNVVAVSLVDQGGREQALALSFVEHTLRADKPWLHLFSFDFHRHCRGLNFDKVSTLVSALSPLLDEMGYCWVDREGRIARAQKGVVRTNCVDCLDRTNVVQSAISFRVCMGQAMRMAVFGPCAEPPERLVEAIKKMWADNGDACSRQYAGTAALKASMARGENKWFGMIKDGMSSVRRYYLYILHDATRQRAINILLNQPDLAPESRDTSIDEENLPDEMEEDLNENLQRLLKETTDFVLPANEVLICGWPLVNPATDGDQVDTVLLLTRQSVYIAIYDEDAERLEDVHIVPLEEVEGIEVGRPHRSPRACLRLVTRMGAWTMRPGNSRLFNNVIIGLKSGEEADEYVESIAEQLRVTLEMMRGGEWRVRPPRLIVGDGAERGHMKLFNKVAGVFKQRKEGERGGRMTTPSAVYVNPTTPSQAPTVSILLDVPGEGGKKEEGGESGAVMRTSQSEGGLAALVKRGLKGPPPPSAASSTSSVFDAFSSQKERAKQSKSVVYFM
ncbi:hypothetical protein PMAYCL1PPCAC_24543 [Pristionchus mayeri]|uniref:SAC domain-containing protein n=1 Tax=Pristionchus mayeri TaxID=1317129 RepID=A0AAN5D0B2_9BILA|nr:hypothetical protein PMAYCL1PPCAC_24543 [Pristionchus mayeri]